jgi:large subunit ribosomal protein LP1
VFEFHSVYSPLSGKSRPASRLFGIKGLSGFKREFQALLDGLTFSASDKVFEFFGKQTELEMNLQLAASYAALILFDSKQEITAESLSAVASAAGVELGAFAAVFARLLAGRDIEKFLVVGGGGAAAAAPAASSRGAPAAAGAAAAAAPAAAEEKKKSSSSEHGDLGGGLFGGDVSFCSFLCVC